MRRKIQVVLAGLMFISAVITLVYVFILKNMQIAGILLSVTGLLGCFLHWFEEISTIYINNRKKGLTGAIREYLDLSKKRLIIWFKNKTVRSYIITYACILTILATTLIFKILFGISMFCGFLLYIISLRVIWGYGKTKMGQIDCWTSSVILTCTLIQVEVIILYYFSTL